MKEEIKARVKAAEARINITMGKITRKGKIVL